MFKELKKRWKRLFKKKRVKKARWNAPLTGEDRKYLDFLVERKKKNLKKRGKRLTKRHRREALNQLRDERFSHTEQVQTHSSGWGFIEYYLLFNWINTPNHYYSNSYTESPQFQDDQVDSSEDSSSDADSSDSDSDDSSSDSDYSSDSSSDWGSSDSSGGSDFSSSDSSSF